MPFSVRILRFFGILLLGVCALGVAGITWAYLIEPNLLFVRQVAYRIPQWNGRGRPLKIVVAGDFHFMPTPFDEVRALRYVQRIMQLKPDLILLVGDYARGSSKNASMSPQKAAQLLQGLEAPCGVFVIQGNHDFTFGWNNWKKELTRIGFRILADKSVLITLNDGRRLQLSGLRESFRYSKKQLRSGIPRTSPTSCCATGRKSTASFQKGTRTSLSAAIPTAARYASLSICYGLKPVRTIPSPIPTPGTFPPETNI